MHAWAVRSGLIGLLARPAHLLGGRAAFLVDPPAHGLELVRRGGSAGAAGFFRCSGGAAASGSGSGSGSGEAPRRPVAARPRSRAAEGAGSSTSVSAPIPAASKSVSSAAATRASASFAEAPLPAGREGPAGPPVHAASGRTGPRLRPRRPRRAPVSRLSSLSPLFHDTEGRATRAAAILDELSFAGPR